MLPNIDGGVLCGDKAYRDGPLKEQLADDQDLDLLTPVKQKRIACRLSDRSVVPTFAPPAGGPAYIKDIPLIFYNHCMFRCMHDKIFWFHYFSLRRDQLQITGPCSLRATRTEKIRAKGLSATINNPMLSKT